MSIFTSAFFVAGGVYALLNQPVILVYFLAVIGVYTVAHYLIPSGRFNPLRRRIMFSTWERPKEGNIHIKIEIDCTNFLKYQEKFQKEEKPSVTHLAIKTVGQVLDQARNTLNGKIIFDKFVPFNSVDVTCLVDINNGEDLAAVTLEKVNEKKITEIRDFINAKGTRIKKNKGDADHKQRVQTFKLLPPFIIRPLLQLVQWLSFNLGISIKSLSLKKDAFGGACVTSLGMLGIKDAFVPFTPFMNCPVILAVSQIQQKPIVKDNQIVIAPVINLNFTVDHRFIDGGKSKGLFQTGQDVFEHPENY